MKLKVWCLGRGGPTMRLVILMKQRKRPRNSLEVIPLLILLNRKELVLDCFAGSGTTGAVAHKMGRRWIMIESKDYSTTIIPRRLTSVIEGGDDGGVTDAVSWKGGGGFRFCKLGEPLFDETGN